MDSIKVTQKKAQKISGYLINSYQDYIAARILYNNNELVQACSLANTAIEKYFKALLKYSNNNLKSGHNLSKILPTIKK